ncbi:MAG TPA: bifunctional phosphopantothenoylcysteine decarboxylase/phosphopantothenate--cysteine ligase CoaBC [Terriglobales bacterium]|nr:bifunctional phosphopantothenoylcysteine decarboxylase/phosphopantothenate--cysteine ligase CoaBC [Terriglobales bacterium]
MRVLLGISGGIAAYKSAELVRRLQQRGHSVQVILTRAAREFVTPLTLATLSGEPVLEDLFTPPAPTTAAPIEHIAVAQAAGVVAVVPATAHTLARMAHGLADDFLTTVLLATPAPVVVAPTMNVQMWRHPATQSNLELLRTRGVTVVPPAAGYLACGMTGEGRMAELDAIVAAIDGASAAAIEVAHAARPTDLAGQTVLVTAGPTREALDPVRFLSNRSSGRMGYALAAAAQRRGARVLLISGPTALTPPPQVECTHVVSAEEMAAAAEAAFPACTMAVLVAAVADYRPLHLSSEKIKKGDPRPLLELTPTPDILAILGRRKTHQRLIGFAAETDAAQGLDWARAKLAAKNADLIVFNDVSQPGIGFDADDNAVTLLDAVGERHLGRAPKATIADQILDAALRLPEYAHHA